MSRSHVLFAVTGALASWALAVACGDSESRAPLAPQDAALDQTTADVGTPPLPDAARDAASDAPLNPCTAQGFCHTPLPVDRTLRAVFARGGVAWAVTEEGDVLRWDGNVWNVHVSGLGPLFAITGASASDVWIGGERGVLHGTGATPAAVTFTADTLPGDTTIPIRALTIDRGVVVAVGGVPTGDAGPRGRVLFRAASDGGTDGGADGAADASSTAWRVDPLSDVPIAFWHAVSSPSLGLFVAGDDGVEYSTSAVVYRRAADAGAFAAVALALDPEGGDSGVIGTVSAAGRTGSDALLFAGRSSVFNPGLWSVAAADASADSGPIVHEFAMRDLNDLRLNAVWGTAKDDVWAAGEYGRLRHWDGSTWMQASIAITGYPVIAPFYGIDGESADDFWVVGKAIAIHYQKGKAQ